MIKWTSAMVAIAIMGMAGCTVTDVSEKKVITANDDWPVQEQGREQPKEKSGEIIEFEHRVEGYDKEHANEYDTKRKVMMDLDKEPYEDPHILTDEEIADTSKVLVNKYNRLPAGYVPADLIDVPSSGENGIVQMRKEAGEAFKRLVNWAKGQGMTLNACSAFRTAEYQEKLWNNGKATGGEDYADKWWTRPSHSEHQTGLAVDIRLNNDTSDLDAVRNQHGYDTLLKNLAEFGFILRYPDDGKDTTLIEPESWHLRYVGKETAKEIAEKGITFEQFIADEKLEDLYKDFPDEIARG